MKLIDTHSHVFSGEFESDLNQVVERAKAAGVIKIFMPNIDCSTLKSLLATASAYPDYCLPMIGLHPTSVNETYRDELRQLKQLLESGTIPFSAIGEVGMDLYWDQSFVKEQSIAFDMQIQWAVEYHLPLVIHSRDSFDEIYSILKNYPKDEICGIFHSFTGSLDEANKIMEFGNFMLGINGVVTFKKATLPEVLKYIPIEKIVLETDSPYLTPAPFRGKRNESSYLTYILNKLAEIYGKSAEEIARLTSENALKVFKMEKYLAESL